MNLSRHERNKQKQKEWHEKNRDLALDNMKSYYQKNKEKIKLQLKINNLKQILQRRHMSIIDRYVREYTPIDEKPIQLLEYTPIDEKSIQLLEYKNNVMILYNGCQI